MLSGMRAAMLAMPRLLASIPPPTRTAHRDPLVVIIGPPRSGTTLTYQLIVRHLACSYVSAAHAALHGTPWLLEPLVRRIDPGRAVGFESDHGRTLGIHGPHEASRLWNRLFPDDRPADLLRVRNELRLWIELAGRCLVCKNVMHVLRMRELAAALTEVRFIRVRRDPLAVARSLLRARESQSGGREGWFSLRPPGWEALQACSPTEQVVGQVMLTELAIDRASSSIGQDRVLTVDYACLCTDPATELARVSAFAGGIALRSTPQPRAERGSVLGDADEAALAAALARWSAHHR